MCEELVDQPGDSDEEKQLKERKRAQAARMVVEIALDQHAEESNASLARVIEGLKDDLRKLRESDSPDDDKINEVERRLYLAEAIPESPWSWKSLL